MFISVLLCYTVTITVLVHFFCFITKSLHVYLSVTLLLLLVLVHVCVVSSLNHCMFISLLLSYTSYSVSAFFFFHH